jgi:hypothetical protein
MMRLALKKERTYNSFGIDARLTPKLLAGVHE